ncbi:MAG: DNA-binding protein [Chloroflexi bacterium]|nr:MAG: DNA-binding protein [Chloroflexota bacterium]
MELPEKDATEIVTTNEIAQIVGVSARTVQRWCHSGELPAKRVGYNFAIVWSDFVSFWQARSEIKK